MSGLKKRPRAFKVLITADKIALLEKHIPEVDKDLETYAAMLKSFAHMINALKLHHREVEYLDLTELSFTLVPVLNQKLGNVIVFFTVRDNFKNTDFKVSFMKGSANEEGGVVFPTRQQSTVFQYLTNLEKLEATG